MVPCYGTHGSRQRVNSKPILEEYKIWVLFSETYVYVVQFRPYKGGKKRKQVASSTKWGFGEKVLRLMECLTPTSSFDIFMDNYFTSFRLVTHLGVNNIRATSVLNKNRLRKCTIIGDKKLQKNERGDFDQCTSSKKAVKL